MPVEIGRSVCGHLISKTAMGPSLLTSFAKVTTQSAIWRVERLVAIMDRSSVTSVTFRRCHTQELQGALYLDADKTSLPSSSSVEAHWGCGGLHKPCGPFCPYTAFSAETLAVCRGPGCNWFRSGTPAGGNTPRAEALFAPSITLPPPHRWTDRGTGSVTRRWLRGRCVSRSHTSFVRN
jgi:hypothetical protein